jgi:hypothetical protein
MPSKSRTGNLKGEKKLVQIKRRRGPTGPQRPRHSRRRRLLASAYSLPRRRPPVVFLAVAAWRLHGEEARWPWPCPGGAAQGREPGRVAPRGELREDARRRGLPAEGPAPAAAGGVGGRGGQGGPPRRPAGATPRRQRRGGRDTSGRLHLPMPEV